MGGVCSYDKKFFACDWWGVFALSSESISSKAQGAIFPMLRMGSWTIFKIADGVNICGKRSTVCLRGRDAEKGKLWSMMSCWPWSDLTGLGQTEEASPISATLAAPVYAYLR